MMTCLRRLLSHFRDLIRRNRHELTTDAERSDIEQRLADQRNRLEYLRAVAEVQQRRSAPRSGS